MQAQTLILPKGVQPERQFTGLLGALDLAVVNHLNGSAVVMHLGRVDERGRTAQIFAGGGPAKAVALGRAP